MRPNSPCVIIFLSVTVLGSKYLRYAVMNCTLFRRQASTIFRPCCTVAARGFSHNTCLPALAAATEYFSCSPGGVAMYTASTSGFFKHSAYSLYEYAWRPLNSCRSFSAFLLSPLTNAISSAPSLCANAGNTATCEMLPRPTTAYPTLFTGGIDESPLGLTVLLFSSLDPRGSGLGPSPLDVPARAAPRCSPSPCTWHSRCCRRPPCCPGIDDARTKPPRGMRRAPTPGTY